MDRISFITGSHAYGTPTDESDIDLVVLCDRDTWLRVVGSSDPIGSGVYGTRYGKLNLILCLNEVEYDCWADGTAYLKGKKPVTRPEAVAHFQKLRKERGIPELRPDANQD